MKLSAKAEYSCLAIIALSQQADGDPPIQAHVIARSFDIPESFLVHILLRLKAVGLITSHRGAAGGYRLTRPAEAISLGDVLRAVECPDRRWNEEPGKVSRVLATVMEDLRAAERAVIDQTSMAHLARRIESRDSHVLNGTYSRKKSS